MKKSDHDQYIIGEIVTIVCLIVLAGGLTLYFFKDIIIPTPPPPEKKEEKQGTGKEGEGAEKKEAPATEEAAIPGEQMDEVKPTDAGPLTKKDPSKG